MTFSKLYLHLQISQMNKRKKIIIAYEIFSHADQANKKIIFLCHY